ncbi:chromosome segregation protein ParM, partial [Streptomyces xiamenensis]
LCKALGIAPDNIPEPLPRSFSKGDEGRIERIMAGEPEPPVDSNTGGVGWIIESVKPEVMRALYMDFGAGIADLFPEQIGRLTDHEIAELEARDLWGDWNRPDEDPDPDGEDG